MKFKITKYKSIVNTQEIELDKNKINVLLGRNSSGKSNILSSIRWFDGASEKNVETNASSNLIIHKQEWEVFNSLKTEVNYTDEISKEDFAFMQQIVDKYKLEMSSEELKKLTYSFSKNSKSLYSNFYRKSNKQLNDVTQMINKILAKYKNFLPKKYFSFEDNSWIYIREEYWETFFEPSKNLEIIDAINATKVKGITFKLKEEMIEMISVLLEIDKHFTKRPFLLYSKNTENENSLIFSYDLSALVTEKNLTNSPELELILKAVNPALIKDLISLFSSKDSKKDQDYTLQKSIIINQINEFFKNQFDFFKFHSKPEVEIDNYKLMIKIVNTKKLYDSMDNSDQSSGYKSLFWMIAILSVIKQLSTEENSIKSSKVLLLLDEPEKNISVALQKRILEYMISIINTIKNNEVYILYSTHSPFFINEKNSKINIVEMDNDGQTKIKAMENTNLNYIELLIPISVASDIFNKMDFYQKIRQNIENGKKVVLAFEKDLKRNSINFDDIKKYLFKELNYEKETVFYPIKDNLYYDQIMNNTAKVQEIELLGKNCQKISELIEYFNLPNSNFVLLTSDIILEICDIKKTWIAHN